MSDLVDEARHVAFLLDCLSTRIEALEQDSANLTALTGELATRDAIEANLRARIEALAAECDAAKFANREGLCRENDDLRKINSEARSRIEVLEKMDRQAATYVESVICMRTDFTGDPWSPQ